VLDTNPQLKQQGRMSGVESSAYNQEAINAEGQINMPEHGV